MLPIKLILSRIFLLGLLSLVPAAKKMQTVYEWRYIDFFWENEHDREKALESGDYNYTKPIMIDVDTWRDGRVFVTVIRDEGVPASLTTVTEKLGKGGPLLKPYPDWSWTRKGECNGITSAYRVAIDECDRMWVLDNGKIGAKQVCDAQLLAFDLNTDNLLERIKIPKSISHNSKTNASLLITPVVDTEGHRCERTHIYMSDVQGNALIVYNGVTFRRLESPVMAPQASATDVEIAGEIFNLPDGIIGMALSPKRSSLKPRYLMFRPFASREMVSAENWNLHESIFGGPVGYYVASGALPSPAVAMAFSTKGVLFFGLTTEMALACWNIEERITEENIVIVDQDPRTHQFASGLKVIPRYANERSEKIWMVTNRFQKIALGTQNFCEINYRVMTGYVDDLIADTNCEPRSSFNKFYKHPRQGR